jgi:hypothetical protein
MVRPPLRPRELLTIHQALSEMMGQDKILKQLQSSTALQMLPHGQVVAPARLLRVKTAAGAAPGTVMREVLRRQDRFVFLATRAHWH